MKVKIYLDLLRVNHWFKNIIIVCGVLVAIIYSPEGLEFFDILFKTALAFLLASLISSVNYIINQIADISFDKKHPEKKHRPLPSGKISIRNAIVLAIILLIVCFTISYSIFSASFVISLLALFLAGILYNIRPIRLKDVPFVDVLSESFNNPIRLLIGWFVVMQNAFPPIEFLLLVWFVGAVFMTSKRYDELKFFGKKLVPYRHTFNKYTLVSLRNLIFLYSGISLLLIAYIMWIYQRNMLILWPLYLVFFIWLNKTVISGSANARSIESFVLTRRFLGIITVLTAWTLVVFFFRN